jgi:hypothetical protein
MKQNSLETHKGLVRQHFRLSCHRVIVTTSMETRNATTIMIDAIRREKIVQKVLRRHWPDNVFLYHFCHRGPRFNAIFPSSGERECGTMGLDWSWLRKGICSSRECSGVQDHDCIVDGVRS